MSTCNLYLFICNVVAVDKPENICSILFWQYRLKHDFWAVPSPLTFSGPERNNKTKKPKHKIFIPENAMSAWLDFPINDLNRCKLCITSGLHYLHFTHLNAVLISVIRCRYDFIIWDFDSNKFKCVLEAAFEKCSQISIILISNSEFPLSEFCIFSVITNLT